MSSRAWHFGVWHFCLLLFLTFMSAKAETPTEYSRGDKGAPVILLEYASLTCPHCATFHNEVVSQLSPYIDSGDLLYIYRDFPLDNVALSASMLARCVAARADSSHYFKFLDLLYKNQNKWLEATDIKEALFQLSALTGLDASNSQACLENIEVYDSVLSSRKQGVADGVESTPTVFINGKKLSNANLASVKQRIETLLR